MGKCQWKQQFGSLLSWFSSLQMKHLLSLSSNYITEVVGRHQHLHFVLKLYSCVLTVLAQCIFLQTTEVETLDFFISVCFYYLVRVGKRSCCGLTNLVWSPQTWLKFAPRSFQKYPVVSHCKKSMCRNKVLDCNHLAWQPSRLLLHH